jgi:hypothetical protein
MHNYLLSILIIKYDSYKIMISKKKHTQCIMGTLYQCSLLRCHVIPPVEEIFDLEYYKYYITTPPQVTTHVN